MLDRRMALGVMASAVTGLAPRLFAGAENPVARSKLGLLSYTCGFQRRWLAENGGGLDLNRPHDFLEHCRQIGARGLQTSLGILNRDEALELHRQAEKFGMYVEAIVSVPQDEADIDRFRRDVQIAAWSGARAMRTVVMPGRRYERFDSLEEFNTLTSHALKALHRAAPVVEELKVPLAVENHKDHRTDFRIQMLQEVSSEYVGACVDTGNSVALLENPLETVKGLAPWVKSVHLKDQALAPDEAGFLLADIPLGQGYLPLRDMVQILRQANPQLEFNLELITRDPLLVPVWGEKYWSTFPDLPATELARTMRDVHRHEARNLQFPSRLQLPEQVALEKENIRASLDFAGEALGL